MESEKRKGGRFFGLLASDGEKIHWKSTSNFFNRSIVKKLCRSIRKCTSRVNTGIFRILYSRFCSCLGACKYTPDC